MDEYAIDTKKIIDGKTVPFGYLTEAELITQLEAHHIGSAGSAAQHLKRLIDNDYLRVNKKSRALAPTDVGTAIVKALHHVDPELVSPKVRAGIEKACAKIAYDEADSTQVVNHVLGCFKSKFDYLVRHSGVVEKWFDIEVASKCAASDDIAVKPDARDGKDPKDRKNKSASFPDEPVGYEHATVYEDHKEPAKKKPPKLKCRDCEAGVLKEAPVRIAISTFVLLRCASCKSTLKCFKDNEGFSVSETPCDECGCAKVRVKYSLKESPLPLFANQHFGCIYCDSALRNLIEFPKPRDGPAVAEQPKDAKKKPKDQPASKANTNKPAEPSSVIIITKKKKRR